MGVFSKRRRGAPYRADSDEERIARYVYLLNSLPAAVVESAHADAFRDVPAYRRREMFAELAPFRSGSERDAKADDPTVLARLVRRAEEHRARRAEAAPAADSGAVITGRIGDDPRDRVDSRDMMLRNGVAVVVAQNFLVSVAVTTYFTLGAGSLQLATAPAWLSDDYDTSAFALGDASVIGGPDAGAFHGWDGAALHGFDGGGFDNG